jgi:hypothetical protein
LLLLLPLPLSLLLEERKNLLTVDAGEEPRMPPLAVVPAPAPPLPLPKEDRKRRRGEGSSWNTCSTGAGVLLPPLLREGPRTGAVKSVSTESREISLRLLLVLLLYPASTSSKCVYRLPRGIAELLVAWLLLLAAEFGTGL